MVSVVSTRYVKILGMTVERMRLPIAFAFGARRELQPSAKRESQPDSSTFPGPV